MGNHCWRTPSPLNQEEYLKLVSGQKSGPAVALLSFLLSVAAIFYAIAIWLRTFLYSKGLLKTHRAGARVISIGNITVGGTGKTPLVIWLCMFLQQKGTRCAVLTRGYKTHRASCVMRRARSKRNTQYDIRNTMDEPAILSESCPQAKVVVNPDRVAGAAEAVNQFGAEVLIMDDGFQHRRLARDLDIVAIDATRPFGYGRLLPAGLLREPVTALKRADAVVITRCDQIGQDELTALERKLRRLNPQAVIARSIHAPLVARTAEREDISLKELRNRKIFAFCGIGNPQAFFDTVKGVGCDPAGSKVYDDHHHYTPGDVADICEEAERSKADLILTTEKDWTKIDARDAAKRNMPLAYLAVQIEFLAGQDRLEGLIENVLRSKILDK
jgi:tetraacyldisaccharide 4'-kinase